jgi:broad specificity phosphatase PhoE
MTTLLLIRHGESDWNAEQRWQGHSDRRLTERGREQARELAEQLADVTVDAVYCSDLLRARETAEILAEPKGLEVRPLTALREIDVGEWSGLTWPELEERFPEAVGRYHETGRGWEHGEWHDEMAARVLAAVREIAGTHPDETVLVVGHGGPIRAVLAHADGVDPDESLRRIGTIENCVFHPVVVRDGTLERVELH